MNRIKPILFLLAILAVSFFVSYWLYPSVHILGALHLDVDKQEIQQKAEQITRAYGILPEKYETEFELVSRSAMIQQVQEKYGLLNANRKLRDFLPGFYWDVRFKEINPEKKSRGAVTVTAGDGSSPRARDSRSREIRLNFDIHGNLLSYRQTLPDSLPLTGLSEEQAKTIASRFVQENTPFKILTGNAALEDTGNVNRKLLIQNETNGISGDSINIIQSRTDYRFNWVSRLQYLEENKIDILVAVTGDRITQLNVKYNIPEQYKLKIDSIVLGVSSGLLYIVFAILAVVIAFRRFRAYEISFRRALILAASITILYAIELYMMLIDQGVWEMLIPLIIAPLFFGGVFIVLWAVSESVVRET